MEEIDEEEEEEERNEEELYMELMSKLSTNTSNSGRFKESVMKELSRRATSPRTTTKDELQTNSSPPGTMTTKNLPPPPPPPPTVPPPPSSSQYDSSSQSTNYRKDTRQEKIDEITQLRSQLYITEQTSAFRGLRCMFEKLSRRECEKRMKFMSRDRRVHELEAMVSRRDSKIATLNKEIQEMSNTRDRQHLDEMQSIQLETSKMVHEIKSTAKQSAELSNRRHEEEIQELTRNKDEEIEVLRAQLLKFHTNIEEMTRAKTKQDRQSKAKSAHELSLTRSELQSVRSNLEVSRAKCEMLERTSVEIQDKFEKERQEMRRAASANQKIMSEKMAKMKLEKSSLDQNLKDAKHEINALRELLVEKENQTQRAVKHAAEMVLGEVQRATQSSKRECEGLRGRVRDLEIERVRLQTKLEDMEINFENQKDICLDRESELRDIQNQHLELSQDYEKQIRGLHDLLVERDQQVQRLGEILQQEMAKTDVETGSTPRIEDLVDRVRHMQDAVASIVASHFEERSPSSKKSSTMSRKEKIVSPPKEDIKSALKMSFNRADEIHRRHLTRLNTPLK